MRRWSRFMAFVVANSILALFVGALSGPANADSTWSNGVKVAESTENLYDTAIAMSSDGTYQYLAYRMQDQGSFRMRLSRSADSGKNWTDVGWISDAGEPAQVPRIACSADGSTVTVTWIGQIPSGIVVEATTLSDHGTTIVRQRPVSSPGVQGEAPAIVMSADGQRQTIAWHGYNANTSFKYVNAITTSDGGATWPNSAAVIGTASAQDREDVSLASSADGQHLAMVWAQVVGSTMAALFASSSDGGATWSSPVQLNAGQAHDGSTPFVTSSTDGLTIHAAWQQDTGSGNSLPMIMTSTDGGLNFDSYLTVNVLDMTNTLSGLVASADGAYVSVLAISDPGATKKAYVVSTDQTSNWRTFSLAQVMDTGVDSFVGSMSADGSVVTAVASTSSVKAFTSTDHGASWSDSATLSSWGELSHLASVASSSDGSVVGVGWRSFVAPDQRRIYVAERGEAGPVSLRAATSDFGTVTLGNAATTEFTVTNSSLPVATLSSISATGAGVSVSGGTCTSGTTLSVGATCTIKLSWTPSAIGALANAGLTVTWNGRPDATATLTGSAVRASQALSSMVSFPKVIHAGKPTTLVKKTLHTTAGQTVASRVRCTPPTTLLTTGDVTFCTVTTKKHGRVVVTASTGSRVVLRLTAKGTDVLKPFAKTVRWTVK